MIGTINSYTTQDWTKDIKAAQAAGINAFALNCANEQQTVKQIPLAYQTAESLNFKVFLSFDMNSYAKRKEISFSLRKKTETQISVVQRIGASRIPATRSIPFPLLRKCSTLMPRAKLSYSMYDFDRSVLSITNTKEFRTAKPSCLGSAAILFLGKESCRRISDLCLSALCRTITSPATSSPALSLTVLSAGVSQTSLIYNKKLIISSSMANR